MKHNIIRLEWKCEYRGELLVLLSKPPHNDGEFRLLAELYDVRPIDHCGNQRQEFLFRNIRHVTPVRGRIDFLIGRVTFAEGDL